MNCREARQEFHLRLDEGGQDPELDRHIESCGECRGYAGRMARLVEVFDDLRIETASLVAETGGRLGNRFRVNPSRLRRANLMRFAASILIVASAFVYYRGHKDIGQAPPGIVALPVNSVLPSEAPLDIIRDARLGMTLRGESSNRYMVIPQETSGPDVQVFWLYPSSSGSAKSSRSLSTKGEKT